MQKVRRLVVALVTVVLLAAASVPASAAETTLAVQHTFWDVMQVVKQVRESVVGVVVEFPPAQKGGRVSLGGGTGIVYRSDGYIITNAHVVYGAASVTVLLPGGKTAKVAAADVWTDHVSDIAVLRLPGQTLKAPVWADSDKVEVGQLAVAIGNPLGFRLGNTVSVGVISGIGRSLGTGYPFLQHDAAINPGNSGGPLLNAAGQVLGVNSVKVTGSVIDGLSFAIPANVAKQVADALIKDKKITRVWLGLDLYESDLADYGLPTDEGLEVGRVYSDSPARGQVQKGDILEAINGKAVHTLDDVSAQLSGLRAGQGVRLTLKRDSTRLEKAVTLAEMPNRPLDEEDESLRVAGVWRNMTDAQVEQALKDATSLLTQKIDATLQPYIKKDSKASVFFQTEYIHVIWTIWGRLRNSSDNDFPPYLGEQAVYEIRGKFDAKLMVPGGGHEIPTATLSQGSHVVTGERVSALVTSTPPNFRPEKSEGVNTYTLWDFRFDSTKFDLTKPVTLKVTSKAGLNATYTFELKDLR